MRTAPIFVALLFACGAPPLSLEHRGGAADPILDGWRSDYRHPFIPSQERPRRWTKVHQRCLAGDRVACWSGFDTAEQLAANCRAGDRMSCRAIVIDEPKLPGGVGRDTVVCALRRLDRCDLVALSKECSDGFPHSCKLVRDVLEELHVPIAGAWLADRIRDLGESGCRQGIVSECSFADEPLRADVLCRRDRRCQPLAWVALDRGEMERAHRIFEYGCQLGEIDTCRNLGVLYEQKRFVEPIEGRGRKLVEWACEQTASVAREPAWAYEQCVRDALGP